jgi:hypothetical protein
MTLLQNVGVVRYSLFTELVNSLFPRWVPFTMINEFTQHQVKSFGK